MIHLSIVIPTYQRPQILCQALEYIAAQTIANDIEVIVVSDGPGPETAHIIQSRTWPMPVRFAEVPKSQQGVARNAGVDLATGEYILFIGDDIFLAPNACAEHLFRHSSPLCKQQPSAVLGFTTWDPACGITPVMKWLEASGWQFGYPKIAAFTNTQVPPDRQHWFTYTSHISVPTHIAKSVRFRADITGYGWEDTEWGLRLRQANVPLWYQPSAQALHHHHLELADSLKRLTQIGNNAVQIEKLNPDIHAVPRGLRLLKQQLKALLPTLSGQHARAFLAGIRSKKLTS